MSEAARRVRALFHTADRTPWGPECGALLAEAVAIAESAGEEQWAYAARMRQCVNASFMDDNELLLASFAVCESQHAADPLRFPAEPKDMGAPGVDYTFADLYWIWKWIPGILMQSPDFPAAAIDASIVDLERAYRRAGLGLKVIAQRQLNWAVERHDLAEIRRLSEVVAEMADDDHSDCPACSQSRLVEAALALGEETKALAILEQIVEAGYDCVHEPALAYSVCLDALAITRNLHRINTAIEEILTNENLILMSVLAIARLGCFLVRVGNSGHVMALSLLRKVLYRMAEAPFDKWTHVELLTGLAAAGRANVRSGHGDMPLPEADDPRLTHYFGHRSGGHTIASAAEAAEASARALAAAFDRRNGSSSYIDRLEDRLDTNVRYDLTVELPVNPDLAFASSMIGAESLFRVDDPVVPEPSDTAAALRAIVSLTVFDRPEEAVKIAQRWLPKVESILHRSALLNEMARGLSRMGQEEAAASYAEQSLQCLREAGHDDIADIVSVLGRFAYAPSTEADHDEIRSMVEGLELCEIDPGLVGLIVAFEPAPFATPKLFGHALELVEQAEPVLKRLGPDHSWTGYPALAKVALVGDSKASREATMRVLEELPEPYSDREAATIVDLKSVAKSADRDHAAALEEQLALYRIVSAWGSAPTRARFAMRLAETASQANAASEVLAVGNFLERIAPSLAPNTAANLLLFQADSEVAVEAYRPALQHAELAVSLSKIPQPPDSSLIGEANRRFGQLCVDFGRDKEASAAFFTAADAFEAVGRIDDSTHCALMAGGAEVRRGNVILAGQIAEAILGSLDRLATDRWPVETKAHQLLVEAAVKTVSDQLTVEAVEQIFANAHDAVNRSLKPDEARYSHVVLTKLRVDWLLRREQVREALAPAREVVQWANAEGNPQHRGESSLTLADILYRLSAVNPETAEESRVILAGILDDPELEPYHDSATLLTAKLDARR